MKCVSNNKSNHVVQPNSLFAFIIHTNLDDIRCSNFKNNWFLNVCIFEGSLESIEWQAGPEFDGLVFKFFDEHFLKMYGIWHESAKTNMSFDIQVLIMKSSIWCFIIIHFITIESIQRYTNTHILPHKDNEIIQSEYLIIIYFLKPKKHKKMFIIPWLLILSIVQYVSTLMILSFSLSLQTKG